MKSDQYIKLEQAHTLKRRKRKTKLYDNQDKGICQGFYFPGQCVIECVVGFRIKSHTVKRELKIANTVI
jgi:hypothetical protein